MILMRQRRCAWSLGFKLLTTLLLVGCSAKKFTASTAVPPENLVTFRIVEIDSVPLIQKGSPGTEGNKYGFEGGTLWKDGENLHWFTAEIFEDPQVVKMRLAYWSSNDGRNWRRVKTLYESSGEFTGQDPRAALWGPMPVFDAQSNVWNLFYVGYKAKPNTDSSWYLNHEGRIYRAISELKGKDGLAGPYHRDSVILAPSQKSDPWEGLQGVDSFYPYRTGNKWMAFYGSAQTQYIPCPFWGVGLAEAPELQGPWIRKSALNPVDLQSRFAENPVVTKLENGLYLALVDGGSINENFGYTYSKDGVHWAPATFIETSDSERRWWSLMRTPLGLVKDDDDTYTIYFTAFTTSNFACLGRAKVKVILAGN